jgi:hypothetical protein
MYKQKYLKYKNKYLMLKQILGGSSEEVIAECAKQIETIQSNNEMKHSSQNCNKCAQDMIPQVAVKNNTIHKDKYFQDNNFIGSCVIPDKRCFQNGLLDSNLYKNVNHTLFDLMDVNFTIETINTICNENRLVIGKLDSVICSGPVTSCLIIVLEGKKHDAEFVIFMHINSTVTTQNRYGLDPNITGYGKFDYINLITPDNIWFTILDLINEVGFKFKKMSILGSYTEDDQNATYEIGFGLPSNNIKITRKNENIIKELVEKNLKIKQLDMIRCENQCIYTYKAGNIIHTLI